MGVLNHLFGSSESVAEDIEAESLQKKWKEYLSTVPKKKAIIERFKGDLKDQQELKRLLTLELVDISDEEKEESGLISDLEALEHSEKIKRVHKLEQCLGYAETKYEYVYQLLHHVHSILRSQIHLLKNLADSKKPEKIIEHLKAQLELEIEIIKKIEQIGTFHDLFLALVRGEQIIKGMDEREKRLLKKMERGMSKIFSNEKKEGVAYEWAMDVFDGIEDKVHEAVAEGRLDYHPDMDFEFANRPEFVDLVRECIQRLKKKDVSEQMINVFVHLFREWYNHGRD